MLGKQLKIFLTVAKHHSISNAADELGLTQPALSKIIRHLEDEFGMPLFARHRRGVTLTAEGQTLLQHVQAASIEIEHAREEIDAARGKCKIELRLHCGTLYALDWIHRPVRAMAQSNPLVNFVIDATAYENTVAQLLTGKYDAIFGYVGDASQDRRLSFTPIHRVKTLIFGRVNHPYSIIPPGLETLSKAQWCQFSDVFRTNERLETYLRSQTGRSPLVRFQTSLLSTALELVRKTDALICLPSPLRDFAKSHQLQPIAGDYDIWNYETGCLLRRSSSHFELLDQLTRLVEQSILTNKSVNHG